MPVHRIPDTLPGRGDTEDGGLLAVGNPQPVIAALLLEGRLVNVDGLLLGNKPPNRLEGLLHRLVAASLEAGDRPCRDRQPPDLLRQLLDLPD